MHPEESARGRAGRRKWHRNLHGFANMAITMVREIDRIPKETRHLAATIHEDLHLKDYETNPQMNTFARRALAMHCDYN